jgi:recombination associated protein RdgC
VSVVTWVPAGLIQNGQVSAIQFMYNPALVTFTDLAKQAGTLLMWFKNIRLYRITKPFAFTAQQLAEKLADHAFVPCGSAERSRTGWVSPLGRDEETLVHALGPYLMLCARKDEKLLPASVVNEVLLEKVEEIEARQGRKVYRKEKLQLKDDVTASLLPRAFCRSRRLFAYLAPREDLLVINTSSAGQAEELIAALREALGSMPVVPVDVQHAPSAVMTAWLKAQQADQQFVINQDCELFNPLEDGNVIRFTGQDLYADETHVHLAAGKQVKKLGVVWNNSLSCVIANDLTITRVKFEDMVLEKAQESDAESAAQQFDQDFAVMTLELSGFFKSLLAAFGGAKLPDV